ncbi:MAG: hypothetical protein LBG20_04465 [Holosporaceae bacterium]|jgi:hypothetical protein|nr:hypothetical protein [Holosporaceae bacterium]
MRGDNEFTDLGEAFWAHKFLSNITNPTPQQRETIDVLERKIDALFSIVDSVNFHKENYIQNIILQPLLNQESCAWKIGKNLPSLDEETQKYIENYVTNDNG